MQVSDDKGLLGYLPVTCSALGFALVSLGRGEGLEYLERGATLQAKSAIRTRLPEFYVRWADGLLMAGRVEEARQTVETALAIAAESGERGHEAEALWVAGRVAAAGRDTGTTTAIGATRKDSTIHAPASSTPWPRPPPPLHHDAVPGLMRRRRAGAGSRSATSARA